MVEVLPVPGGLLNIVDLRCQPDYGENLPLNKPKTIDLERTYYSSCLWLIDIVCGHSVFHLALLKGRQGRYLGS